MYLFVLSYSTPFQFVCRGTCWWVLLTVSYMFMEANLWNQQRLMSMIGAVIVPKSKKHVSYNIIYISLYSYGTQYTGPFMDDLAIEIATAAGSSQRCSDPLYHSTARIFQVVADLPEWNPISLPHPYHILTSDSNVTWKIGWTLSVEWLMVLQSPISRNEKASFQEGHPARPFRKVMGYLLHV